MVIFVSITICPFQTYVIYNFPAQKYWCQFCSYGSNKVITNALIKKLASIELVHILISDIIYLHE